MKKLQQKQAFTLIEMLVASTIFAIIVVISASAFGTSAKSQLNSRSAIENEKLASSINDKIFDDLKSATGWGKVRAYFGDENRLENYKIKGIVFMELTSASRLKLLPEVEKNEVGSVAEPNLIIGFTGSGSSSVVTVYFISGNHLYKTVKVFDSTNPLTADTLKNDFDLVNPEKEIKSDNAKILSFIIYGQNYISNPVNNQSGRLNPINKVQPIIIWEATVVDTNTNQREFQTIDSVSSRNYVEEIN